MKHIAASFVIYIIAFVIFRHLSPSGIIFYQGLFVAVIVASIQYFLLGFIGSDRAVVRLKDALLSFLLAYAFMFTVPTTVDRAYSVKMLLQLAQRPDGMTQAEISDFYVHDFINNGAISKRLNEQTATGSLQEMQGRYHLSALGKGLATSFEWMRWLFACKG